MITSIGLYANGTITETGEFVFSEVTETGEFTGVYAPFVEGGGAVSGGGAVATVGITITPVGGAVAGGSAAVTVGITTISTGGSVSGGEAIIEFIPAVKAHRPVGGAVAGDAAVMSIGVTVTPMGGAVAGGTAITSFFNNISSVASPPYGWQNNASPAAPGPSGAWNSVTAPLLPAHQSLEPIYALTDYSITINMQDITGRVERCSIDESETSAFSTCTLELPVGIDINQGDAVAVIMAGVSRLYLVEDVTSTGPARSVWCRSTAAVLDEPHAAEGSWNGWDTPYTTALQLAQAVCGTVPLTWSLPDWALPPRWELTGTPIEVLQTLVASVGGIVQSTPAGGMIARKRWPVRPPDMPAAVPVATISRDTALEDTALTAKLTAGKGYGRVTVYGYDPAADLPDMQVEESSPVLGSPVHVRLFWPSANPPSFDSFITDGSALKLGAVDFEVVDEEIIFEAGVASTQYPIKRLHGVTWIGNNGGQVWWLQNGSSKEISTITPGIRGIAKVSYTTRYERWQLSGQTAKKCMFGIDVGQGQVAVAVIYRSGGSVAPSITASLVNDTTGCTEAGTAFLDNNRAYITVSALLPLTTEAIATGSTVLINDPVTGVTANGKVVSAPITLEPGKTTRSVEVHVPC